MRYCVVNVANGTWYPRGQDRLATSLKAFAPDAGRLFWRGSYPPGSPTHEECKYAFKTHALLEARRQGYDIAIWADASVWFVANPSPLLKKIAKHGWWCRQCGFSVGQWCSDAALEILGEDREHLFAMKQCMGTFYGLDLNGPTATFVLDFLQKYQAALHGPHSNDHGQASSDPRVSGHRHDQVVLSVAFNRLGLEPLRTQSIFLYRSEPSNPAAIAIAEGL